MTLQPRDLGVWHDNWRPEQFETYSWMRDIKTVGICEQDPGSGKSATAKALAHEKSVWVLTRTKALQDAYGSLYDAVVLKGRSNFTCVHPDNRGATCADCLFIEEGMHRCPCSTACEYLQRKELALASPFVAGNYAYWLASRAARQRPPQIVVLDEAHNVSEIVTQWSGATITERDRVEWSLPDFPTITGKRQSGIFFVSTGPPPAEVAIDWLTKARKVMGAHYLRLKKAAKTNTKHRDALHKCENLGRKLRNAKDALERCAEDWYIRAGRTALKFGQEKRPGFVAKPLTAKYHFGNYFLNGHSTIMMSATIGDDKTFTEELGVTDYASRVVPSRFSPSERAVFVLDTPGMGSTATKKNPQYFDMHAKTIADFIEKYPSNYLVLIHLPSKYKSYQLAGRLGSLGLGSRVWVPPEVGSEHQVRAWEKERRKNPGLVTLAWSWGEGMDLPQVKLNIIGGIPFGYLGDEYEFTRMKYNGKMYRQRAAWGVEQWCGRNRRGEPWQYFIDGHEGNIVAIADGNWTMLKDYYSAAFGESLISV